MHPSGIARSQILAKILPGSWIPRSEMSRSATDFETFLLQPRSRPSDYHRRVRPRYSGTIRSDFSFIDTHRYLHVCPVIQLGIRVQGYHRHGAVLQEDRALDGRDVRIHRYVLILVVVIVVEVVIVVQHGVNRSLGTRTDGAPAVDPRVTLDELNRV